VVTYGPGDQPRHIYASTMASMRAVGLVLAVSLVVGACSGAPVGGLEWERLTSENFPDILSSDLRTIVAGGPGFVAAGSDDVSGDAVVWVSEDGTQWTRVAEAALTKPDTNERIEAIAVGGAGLVAIGNQWVEGRYGGGEYSDGTHPVAWVSPDGSAWMRVDDDAFLGPEGSRVWASDITVGGPGFVAVGEVRQADYSRLAVVWVSDDGTDWDRVAQAEGIWGESLVSITSTGTDLVAIGYIDRPVIMIWTSPDGLRWQAATSLSQVR